MVVRVRGERADDDVYIGRGRCPPASRWGRSLTRLSHLAGRFGTTLGGSREEVIETCRMDLS